ncbi:MAG: hypothetical protein ACRD3W_09340 [Terriglobales bacterium]
MLRKAWLLFSALVILFSVGSLPTWACMGPNVLFQEDFSDADLSWDTNSFDTSSSTIEDGHLTLKAHNGGGIMILDNAVNLHDADFCSELTETALATPDGPAGSVIFYAQDYATYYEIIFSAPNYFKVGHAHDNAYDTLVDWRQSNAANCAAGQKFKVRVLMKGPRVSFFVNGTSLGGLTVTPPTAGSKIGFAMDSVSKNPAEAVLQVDNIKITDIAPAAK